MSFMFLTLVHDQRRAGFLEAWQFQFYRRSRSIWSKPSRAVGQYWRTCKGPCSRSAEPKVGWLSFLNFESCVWLGWHLPSHLDLWCVALEAEQILIFIVMPWTAIDKSARLAFEDDRIEDPGLPSTPLSASYVQVLHSGWLCSPPRYEWFRVGQVRVSFQLIRFTESKERKITFYASKKTHHEKIILGFLGRRVLSPV